MTGGDLNASMSFMMEARLKVFGISSGNGVFFEVYDGVNSYGAFFFDTGQVRLADNTFVTINDMSQFHTYAIASVGDSSTYTFFVDGISAATASATGTSLNGFQWGDGGGGVGAANADWDFVHFAQQPIPARGLSLAGTLCWFFT